MLGLSVRVLPLLRREVQMSDVRVEGLNLRLNRDKDGHGNWEDIGKAPAPVTPTTLAVTPGDHAGADHHLSGKIGPTDPPGHRQPDRQQRAR